MMRCANCGVDVVEGSAFCSSCGKPASSMPPPVNAALQPNVAGLLCYVVGLFTGIFFLIADPYKRDRFVRFHAFQSIFLSVAWIALSMAFGIFYTMLPGMLWSVGWMLHSLLSLAIFLLWLFLMYKAYHNEKFSLPILGDLAEKQA